MATGNIKQSVFAWEGKDRTAVFALGTMYGQKQVLFPALDSAHPASHEGRNLFP